MWCPINLVTDYSRLFAGDHLTKIFDDLSFTILKVLNIFNRFTNIFDHLLKFCERFRLFSYDFTNNIEPYYDQNSQTVLIILIGEI